MNITYKHLSALLKVDAIAAPDGRATLTVEQLSTIEDELILAKGEIEDKARTIEERDKTIADLQAKLAAKPAEASSQVVEDNKPSGAAGPKNDVEQFVETYNSARALYNEV